MKAVVKILSIFSVLVFSSVSLKAQSSFIVKKKYEILPLVTSNFADSTFTNYRYELPKTYSFDKLAFFCKIEEKVAQKSNVNMRFRLGSLDYVNYLEQKPNWQLSKSNTN